MKDRKLIFTIIAIMVIGIVIAKTANYMNRDSIKFKREYESLNGEKNESGKTIRSLTIPKENPIKYATAEDIAEKMDNKETFAVYFGFANCPWCRSILPTLLEEAEELQIKEIYYVDVSEIRDQLELNREKDVVIKKKGTDGYYDLLRRFDDKLEKYILTTEDGEEVDVYFYVQVDEDVYKVEMSGAKFIGEEGKFPPVITIESLTNTTNSITIKIKVSRNEGGELIIYKKNGGSNERTGK